MLLNILYKNHVTNNYVRKKIKAVIAEFYELLANVKKRKLTSQVFVLCVCVFCLFDSEKMPLFAIVKRKRRNDINDSIFCVYLPTD